MLGLYVPQCSISFVELGIYSKVGGALHLAEARQKQWGVSLGTIAHPRPGLKHKKNRISRRLLSISHFPLIMVLQVALSFNFRGMSLENC